MIITKQEQDEITAAEAKRLGIGDEGSLRRHQEIMDLVEAAQENGSRRRGAPQGSEQS